MISMNNPLSNFGLCLLMTCFSASAQTSKLSGMQTYSPYTPGQLQELNSQPLSPVEGPFGPIAPSASEFNLSKKPAPDAKYYNQPIGEEEAEALELQSSEPYQSSKPEITI
jgi:hypothetical protein